MVGEIDVVKKDTCTSDKSGTVMEDYKMQHFPIWRAIPIQLSPAWMTTPPTFTTTITDNHYFIYYNNYVDVCSYC